MSPEQNQIYDGLLGKAPAWVRYKVKRGLPPSKQESKNLNAFLSAARQASTTVEPFAKDSGPTPKLQSAFFSLKNSLKKNTRHKAIVFSNYLEGGLKPYAAMLDAAEIPYGMYTGEQPRKYRDELIEQYNKGKIPVLLLSSAGGEGIDLKGTRQVQILEPHWNEEKLEQAVGRAIRFKSHAHLPKDERNVVVEKYISLPRQGFLGKMFGLKKDQGTDEYLIGLAAGKKTLNDQLLDLLRQKDHSALQGIDSGLL
jgi:SNF2 family DNA or RNA helicase